MEQPHGRLQKNLLLRCHLYLVLKNMDLKDVAAFLYGDSIQRDIQYKCQASLGGVDPLYLSNEKVGVNNKMSTDKVAVQMTREEDENGTVDQRPDYLIYVPIVRTVRIE